MDSLSTAKMLLGIKDNEQDDLLSFLIDDMENLINSYCHTAEVPTKLQSLVPQMAAEMYRRKGYGQTAAPQVIKSVTEDKRSVSFETSSASTDTDEFLKEYESRLRPYRCKRGFCQVTSANENYRNIFSVFDNTTAKIAVKGITTITKTHTTS